MSRRPSTIERLIEEHRPKRMVVDPISALERAGGKEIASVVAERLVVMLKMRGISSIFTVVAESNLGEMEAAPTRISRAGSSATSANEAACATFWRR
jgi:hypothetical protein